MSLTPADASTFFTTSLAARPTPLGAGLSDTRTLPERPFTEIGMEFF